MPTQSRIPVAIALAALALSAVPARAADNLLHGPHPFNRENDLAVHVLIAHGLGDAPSGTKLALDYGYKLLGGAIPLWLDLGLHYQRRACSQAPGASDCGAGAADLFESVAGVKWRFQTPIPLVPFAGASAGFVFSFPDGASSAGGVMVRAVGGAIYYFFDWLGISAQVGYSLGHIGYDATYPGGNTYTLLDLGGGLSFQF
jgi:hypothetical protein